MPVSEKERRHRIAVHVDFHRMRMLSDGFSLQVVGASPSFPCFVYTIGLHHTYKHPELVVVGIPNIDQSVSVLLIAIELIRNGSRFDTDQIASAGMLSDDYATAFRSVHPERIEDIFGMACRVYGHSQFNAVQVVWPDRAGRFPFDAEFEERYRQQQPLLYFPPESALVI